jgi:hypothetical protein
MIVSTSGCLTYRLGNYLYRLIRPLFVAASQRTYFVNGNDFFDRFHRYCSIERSLRPTTLFGTITIVNADRLVGHATMLETLHYFLFDQLATNKCQGIAINTIKQLTELYLDNQLFYYDERIYRCNKNGPSQLHYNRLLTNIYLFVWQCCLFDDPHLTNEFIGRHFNQIFFTWNRSASELEHWFARINDEQTRFRFRTMSGMRLSFLNVDMENRHGHLYTRVAAAAAHHPQHPSVVLPYVCGDVLVQHRRWLRTALVRAVVVCSQHDDFECERRRIEFRCLTHGYSSEFIDDNVQAFYHRFNVEQCRFHMNASHYVDMRRQACRLVDIERRMIDRRRHMDNDERLLKFFSLYDYGSARVFHRRFIELWSQSMNDHPTLSSTNVELVVQLKYLFTLNTLLTREYLTDTTRSFITNG